MSTVFAQSTTKPCLPACCHCGSWKQRVEEKRETAKPSHGAKSLRKNKKTQRTTAVRTEGREETYLLELEVQSHRPHPARDGLPRGRVGVPEGRGRRVGKPSRERSGKGRLPGRAGWDLGSWLRPPTPRPNSHHGSASPSALRGRGGASPLPARTQRISLPAILPAIAAQRLSWYVCRR